MINVRKLASASVGIVVLAASVGTACGGGGGSPKAGGGTVKEYCAVAEKYYAAVERARLDVPDDATLGEESFLVVSEYPPFADRFREASPKEIAESVTTMAAAYEEYADAGGVVLGDNTEEVATAEGVVHDFEETECGLSFDFSA